MKLIGEWTDLTDELDELKKIYFEFLKRWTDSDRNDEFDPNRPIIYQVQKDAQEFSLESMMNLDSITEIRDRDEYESTVQTATELWSSSRMN